MAIGGEYTASLIKETAKMISMLITLLLLVIVVYVIKMVIDMLPLPAPVKTIALLIVGLICLVKVLQILGVNL